MNHMKMAKQVLDFITQKYGSLSKHPTEMCTFQNLQATYMVATGDLMGALTTLKGILAVLANRCTDQRFESLIVLIRMAKGIYFTSLSGTFYTPN